MNLAQRPGLNLFAVRVLPILAVFLAPMLLFAPAFHFEYIWDDLIYLVNSSYYAGSGGFAKALGTPFFLSDAYYRPLTVATFLLVLPAADMGPLVQHGINILLHACSACLVYVCARNLAAPAAASDRWWSRVPAVCAALVFAVHPLAVEPVAWVSGRYDVLMTFFVLLTLWFITSRFPGGIRLCGVFLCFMGAIFSKESAVGLVAALPFFHLIQYNVSTGKRLDRAAWRHILRQWPVYAVIIAAALVYIIIRVTVIGAIFSSKATTSFSGPILDRLNIASYAMVEFWKLALNPWGHSSSFHLFNYKAAGHPEAVFYAVAGVLLLLIVSLRWSMAAAPALIFSVALWPALHLFGFPLESIIADRYALCALALALAATAALTANSAQWRLRPVNSRILATSLAAILIIALAAFTRTTLPLWRNESLFWNFSYKIAPDSYVATGNYAKILLLEGKYEESEKLLMKLFHATASPAPSTVANLMTVNRHLGRYEDVEQLFNLADERTFAQMAPYDRAGFFCARGLADIDFKKWNEAAEHLSSAIKADSGSAICTINYARALYKLDRNTEADEMVKRALEYIPSNQHKNAMAQIETWRKSD